MRDQLRATNNGQHSQLLARRVPTPVVQRGTPRDWKAPISRTEHARFDHLLPKLDQAILAKAFRGELVPQDPNDEPASVLLERIRAEREAEKANKPKQRRRRAKAAS